MSFSLAPKTDEAGLRRFVPILQWLPEYNRSWLKTDLLAGVTTSAVVVPQAMAYATIAGLPVQHGLYTAIAAMIVYAVLGTSRVLSVSVTSSLSIMTASVIAGADNPVERAALLAIVVGVIMFGAGIFHLGFIANYFSLPVISGVKAGAGCIIAASQLSNIFGVDVEGDLFFDRIRSLFGNLGQIDWWVFGLAAFSLLLVVGLKHISVMIPGSLIAITIGVLLVKQTSLTDRGVTTVGDIPSGLPSIIFPNLDGAMALIAPAAGIAIMAFVESVTAARVFAEKGEPKIDADQELLALGGGSIFAGLLQGYPIGGGLSQTAVNRETGAKTQVAALVTVAMAILTLTVLMGFVGDIPNAVLGAIVLLAAASLIDLKPFHSLRRIRKDEFVLAIVTFLIVLFFGVLEGVLAGVVASIILLMLEANKAPVDRLLRNPESGRWGPDTVTRYSSDAGDVVVLRPYGRIYFGNAEQVITRMTSHLENRDTKPKAIVIDCSAIPDFEISGMQQLSDYIKELQGAGIDVVLARLNPRADALVQRVIEEAALHALPSYPTVSAAVEAMNNVDADST